jgi:hypothetical protein
MKKIFVAIAFTMLFGSLAYGQKKMTVEQTLMKMEQEMADAVVKKDVSVFEKYAVDSAAFTDPGGTLMNRSQVVAMFKSDDFKMESTKIDDMKVQMFGNTAIVTYRTTDKGKFRNQVIDGQARWTDTFVKMGGKWVMVATQGTPIMKQ